MLVSKTKAGVKNPTGVRFAPGPPFGVYDDSTELGRYHAGFDDLHHRSWSLGVLRVCGSMQGIVDG